MQQPLTPFVYPDFTQESVAASPPGGINRRDGGGSCVRFLLPRFGSPQGVGPQAGHRSPTWAPRPVYAVAVVRGDDSPAPLATGSRAPSYRAYLALAAAGFQRYATYRQAMVLHADDPRGTAQDLI